MKVSRRLILVPLMMVATACVTLGSGDKNKKPPEISEKLNNEEAIEAGLEFGGDTLYEVTKLLQKRRALVAAGRSVEKTLMNSYADMPEHRLINSVNLYQHSESNAAPKMVLKFLDSNKKLHRQLAWHIAAAMPSPAMASTVETYLTAAITENRFDDLYSPKLADAVVSNRLKDSYSILRLGLMETDNVSFAHGMIAIDPKRASADFMDYLAQAPLEELRQLSLMAVDMFVCMEMLKHMQKFPVSIYHPNFSHLFYYATSRNMALAELAQEVIATYSPTHNGYLAYLFNLQPEWLQIAYVEGVRRNVTPVASLFLNEVKKNSSHQEVIDEINSMVN